MFTVHHGGESLSIVFKSEDVIRVGRHGFENVQQISCAIMGNGNIPKGVGISIRAENDAPNDLTGMEHALRRALGRLTQDKFLRAQFWEAFYNAVEGEQDFADFEEAYLGVQQESFDIETQPGPVTFAGQTTQAFRGPVAGPSAAAMPFYNDLGPQPSVPFQGKPLVFDRIVEPLKTERQERIAELQNRLKRCTATDCPYCLSVHEELDTLLFEEQVRDFKSAA